MGLFGWSLKKSSELEGIEKKVDMLESKLYSVRPSLEFFETLGEEGQRVRVYPITPNEIYELAKYSDVLNVIFLALRNEIFKNGWELKEKFVCKCSNPDCGKEFQHEDQDMKCDNCGSVLIQPDAGQKKILEQWENSVNLNKQSLLDVCRMFEDDLNTIDDGFLLLLYDYFFNEEGKIIGKKLNEIIRGSPLTMRIIVNKQGVPASDDSGQELYFCPEHRSRTIKKSQAQLSNYRCNLCKKELLRAYFSSSIREQVAGSVISSPGAFYSDEEVVHTSKYKVSLTYGWSRLITCYQKIVTLLNMDRYMLLYYQKQRAPKGILTAKTTNVESLTKAWYDMLERAKNNPHMVYFLPVEMSEGKGGGNFINYTDMMKSLEEMQYIEARNEMRRSIASVFGVMPLILGETELGMSNQGFQVAVTNRTITSGQGIYNEKIFPKILEALNITDYILELAPNEKRDEMAEEQLKQIKIQNAVNMRSMGFMIKMNEEGEFEYEDAEPQTPNTIEPINQVPAIQPQIFDGEPQHTHDSQEQGTSGMPTNVKREIRKNISQYSAWARAYGDSAQGVGWFTKKEQEERFNTLVKIMPKNGHFTILDAGCGYGHLKNWLDGNKYNADYEGIDILDDYIEKCREKGYNARKEDILDIAKDYDFIFLSGSLNFTKGTISRPDDYAEKAIISMWKSCNKGVAFNFLRVDDFGEYALLDAERIYDSCKELDKNAVIKKTSRDYVIYMSKDRPEKAIFLKKAASLMKEYNEEFVVKDEEAEKLSDFIESEIYSRKFEDLTKEESDKVKKLIIKSVADNWSTSELKRKIKNITKEKISDEKLDVIIKTETAALEGKSQEAYFKLTDPEGKKKYIWSTADDYRVCKACKWLGKETSRGVSLEELKKLVAQANRKWHPDIEPRDFVVHISERCVFSRHF